MWPDKKRDDAMCTACSALYYKFLLVFAITFQEPSSTLLVLLISFHFIGTALLNTIPVSVEYVTLCLKRTNTHVMEKYMYTHSPRTNVCASVNIASKFGDWGVGGDEFAKQ